MPTISPPALQQELDSARKQTDQLFNLLDPPFLYERPVAERHRLIFYLGHLETFDWNLIRRNTPGLGSFRQEFEKLFEAGIDPEPGQLPSDQPSDWPTLDEVRSYNAELRRRIDEVLPCISDVYVNIAIEHRFMHAETLAYLFHNLPYNQKRRVSDNTVDPVGEPTREFIHIPSGVATLGQDPDRFGWDNEFAKHAVQVPAFSVSKYKVTNRDYLGFVYAGARPPHFWAKDGEGWSYRGMFGLTPLPLDCPVYATQEEASAYAAWAGKKLLTEEQFHRAAYGTPQGGERPYPWGDAAPSPIHGNFDFHRWDPVPVNATPAGDSAFGVSQLVGNGWEWTRTPFAPFEGFQPFAWYPNYSANFFDNAHFVIKGASARTAACFLRRSFRNWFRPNYPYVYAGFRLVED